jgi:hypothetical protein
MPSFCGRNKTVTGCQHDGGKQGAFDGTYVALFVHPGGCQTLVLIVNFILVLVRA